MEDGVGRKEEGGRKKEEGGRRKEQKKKQNLHLKGEEKTFSFAIALHFQVRFNSQGCGSYHKVCLLNVPKSRPVIGCAQPIRTF